MAQIDFVPAEISGIERQGSLLVVAFPGQPWIDEHIHDVGVVAVHHCELHIENGQCAGANLFSFPLAIENLRISFAGGARGCFLPIGFQAAGPIEIQVEVQEHGKFEYRVLAVGDAVELRVLEKVEDARLTNEP